MNEQQKRKYFNIFIAVGVTLFCIYLAFITITLLTTEAR